MYASYNFSFDGKDPQNVCQNLVNEGEKKSGAAPVVGMPKQLGESLDVFKNYKGEPRYTQAARECEEFLIKHGLLEKVRADAVEFQNKIDCLRGKQRSGIHTIDRLTFDNVQWPSNICFICSH